MLIETEIDAVSGILKKKGWNVAQGKAAVALAIQAEGEKGVVEMIATAEGLDPKAMTVKQEDDIKARIRKPSPGEVLIGR